MTNTAYSETLFPAIGTQLALALSFPMVFLAALPFGLPFALVASVLGGGITLSVVNLSSPRIAVAENLVAGRFTIPLNAIGTTEPLAGGELKRIVGPQANPAARLVLRGDLKTAVKVEISDPADPTPYLVISTRRPQQLIAAINANRP